MSCCTQWNANINLFSAIQESLGFEDCDQENIQEWLECEIGGHQLLTGDKIFPVLMEDQRPSEAHDNEENFKDEVQAEKDHQLRRLFGA